MATTGRGQREKANLDHLHDIGVEVVVELGRKRMKLSEVKGIDEGDCIVFDNLAGEAFQLLVNSQRLGEGEITVIRDRLDLRLTKMTKPPPQVKDGDTPAVPPPPVVLSESDPRLQMTYVAAGPFTMGGSDPNSPAAQRPAHMVDLSAYFIDPFPVTNTDYREFIRDTGHHVPAHWTGDNFPMGLDMHPVVNVSWQDAQAYADWAAKRLPTDAEWEKAARGNDERPYPWGDRFVEGERCNSSNVVGTTTPVDEFPDGRSAHGLWDMSGNVSEWCADYYDELYYRNSPTKDPRGPGGGAERVVRGGGFMETRSAITTTNRNGAADHSAWDSLGFRCAADG